MLNLSIYFIDNRLNYYIVEFDIDSCYNTDTLIKIPENFTTLFLSTDATLKFVFKNLSVSTYELSNLKHKNIQNQFILISDEFSFTVNITNLNFENIYGLYFKLTKSTFSNQESTNIDKINNIDYKNLNLKNDTVLNNNIITTNINKYNNSLVISLKHQNDTCSINLNTKSPNSILNFNIYLNTSIT